MSLNFEEIKSIIESSFLPYKAEIEAQDYGRKISIEIYDSNNKELFSIVLPIGKISEKDNLENIINEIKSRLNK